jgi:hypothetical protein
MENAAGERISAPSQRSVVLVRLFLHLQPSGSAEELRLPKVALCSCQLDQRMTDACARVPLGRGPGGSRSPSPAPRVSGSCQPLRRKERGSASHLANHVLRPGPGSMAMYGKGKAGVIFILILTWVRWRMDVRAQTEVLGIEVLLASQKCGHKKLTFCYR